jgi:hypothetical protein
MGPVSGTGAADIRAGILDGTGQFSGQVQRYEGRIRRTAQHPATIRGVRTHPFQPGQDTGERSGKTLHHVFGNRKTECIETREITVGVQQHRTNLRRDTFDDVGKDRLSR